MLGESQWLHTYAQRMDPEVRRHAAAYYRRLRVVPCWARRAVEAIWRHTRRIPVIVHHCPELPEADQRTLQAWARSRGAHVGRALPLVRAFSARLAAPALRALLSHPHVERISYDFAVHACLDIASPTIGAPMAWAFKDRGQGVTVAIVDTGIYPHPDLRGRIAAFADLVHRRRSPYDDNGHGTHVAGDVAGDGTASEGRYVGLAPACRLVGIKVLDKQGAALASTIIDGIQWAVTHRQTYNIQVLNLSLGGTAPQSPSADPLCEAVEAAWSAGIVVCVAAGNSGPAPGTIGSPGDDPLVITVGAMDDQRTVDRADDPVADFSSRGPTVDGMVKPDVLCPGVQVVSLRAPGSYLDKADPGARVDSDYMELSGTSMASPICAGAVALLLATFPGLTPDDVKALLRSSAQNRGYDPNTQGAGYIDLARALQQARPPVQAAPGGA